MVALRRVAGRLEPAGVVRDGRRVRRNVLVFAAGSPRRAGGPRRGLRAP
jgi:hypothetical protein